MREREKKKTGLGRGCSHRTGASWLDGWLAVHIGPNTSLASLKGKDKEEENRDGKNRKIKLKK